MKLSVIVPTYNSQDTVVDCLASVSAQKQPDIELIMVDNGSEDETVDLAKNKFPGILLISNRHNAGFSAAMNRGIGLARGEYILALNSDVILKEGFIAKLNRKMELLPPEVGMISPKILRQDGKIDSAGLCLSRLRRFYDIGKGQEDNGQFNSPGHILGPCGGCAVYRKQMLEDIKVGSEYFDEDFFLIAEDFDVAWRANMLGWRGYYLPEIECVHRGGVSRGRSKTSQYYSFRNRYFMLIKNESVAGLARLTLLALIYELPRFIYMLCTNKHTLRALREIRRRLPAMIDKRRSIQRIKTGPRSALRRV